MGVLLCGLVALLLGSAPNHARALPITVQDDAVLLHGSDGSVQSAMTQLASLGASYIRLTASWSTLAPTPTSKSVPRAPFDPSNLATYAAGPLRELDRAVKDATAAGMKVMIDVGFFAPRWAVPVASSDGNDRYEPSPALFAEFAHAVAQRYDGAQKNLPAVRLYTVWNEPNNATFLMPQWRRTPSGWVAASPSIYRGMYAAAHAAIKAISASDLVLIGATAPGGSTTAGTGGVMPMDFVRALACETSTLGPLNTPDCRNYAPLQADGYAHHPYSLDQPPGIGTTVLGDVPLADASRLEALIATLALQGRITSSWPLYDTEYGTQTDPPDPYVPFSPQQQAEYIGWSTFLAWRDPDTKMFAQFLLRDSAPDRGVPFTRAFWGSYQTGLYYQNGIAKPAAEAFRMPFWVQRVAQAGAPIVLLFGQTRAAPAGRQLVAVQELSSDGKHWQPVHTVGISCDSQGDFLTNPNGFFEALAPYTGSPTFRLAWRHPNGVWEYGVPISVDDSSPLLSGAAQPQPGSVQPASLLDAAF
jgi:hypothetical protein